MAEQKIGTRTFRVQEVLATEALMIQARLIQIIGGGVDRLPEILAGVGSDKSEEAKAKSNAAMVGALADIFTKAEPRKTVQLISDLIQYAEVLQPSGAYGRCDVDVDFSSKADRKSLYPVLGFVLKEILGDFFGDVLATGTLQKIIRDLQ
ncbi:hypothetical protein EVC26_048 [Rhizobium phage RHph_I72]|nr:hypothetical protein EVC13_046 [Rhizobium phage RHph_I65]QIG76494.1 hypothetical protein EVC26_048 [Rhizobium phage RHph_I72]